MIIDPGTPLGDLVDTLHAMPQPEPPAPSADMASKEYVAAYVAGAIDAAVKPKRPVRQVWALWWALDTLLREYESGGTFEDLRSDLVRLKDEHLPMGRTSDDE